jgi:hypothetical protein
MARRLCGAINLTARSAFPISKRRSRTAINSVKPSENSGNPNKKGELNDCLQNRTRLPSGIRGLRSIRGKFHPRRKVIMWIIFKNDENRWLGETTWVEDAQQARRISAEEASTIPWLHYGIALRSSLGPALRRVANADALRVSIRAKTQCHTGGVVKLPPTLRAALASDLRASRGARECSTPAVRRAAARRQPR